ncbi:MAG: endolytic transglycosylase MltG [bacterium]|nr:endolytic transglycosylase MltG [bacterium]
MFDIKKIDWDKRMLSLLGIIKDNKMTTAPIALIAALVLAGAVLVFLPKSPGGPIVEVNIEKGQSVRQTAITLYDKGIIRSRTFFTWYAVITGSQSRFKAGVYEISSGMSTYELVRNFSLGLSRSEDISVRIFEGMNIFEIDKRLATMGLIELGGLLNEKALGQEGYLFPDTYRFHPPDKIKLSVEDIIKRFKDNFNQKTAELFLGLSSEEKEKAVIVASILEKEVRTFNDMRIVAGIIEKRMEIGMKLELDATVAYGVCLPKLKLGEPCDATQVNLVDSIPKDTEYNTYRREGLPAGPISNPGLRAIEAALNPLPSQYLFYLNTRDTGETIFSRTGAEHVENRRKYLGL